VKKLSYLVFDNSNASYGSVKGKVM